VRVAGCVFIKRGYGKVSFATLGDGEARLQVYVRSDEVGEAAYRVFDLVDLGDFVSVANGVMRTRKSELSVQARAIVVLSKALLPPGEVARARGRRDALPAALPRPPGQPGGPATFLVRSAMVARCGGSSTSAATSRSRRR
jgi:hypothetical protein